MQKKKTTVSNIAEQQGGGKDCHHGYKLFQSLKTLSHDISYSPSTAKESWDETTNRPLEG